MTSTTLDIFNLLVDAGIEKSKAEPLAREIITRSDAAHFSTKTDIADLKAEMYRVSILQSGFIVAAVGLMFAFVR
jgi:hypothetical protein